MVFYSNSCTHVQYGLQEHQDRNWLRQKQYYSQISVITSFIKVYLIHHPTSLNPAHQFQHLYTLSPPQTTQINSRQVYTNNIRKVINSFLRASGTRSIIKNSKQLCSHFQFPQATRIVLKRQFSYPGITILVLSSLTL